MNLAEACNEWFKEHTMVKNVTETVSIVTLPMMDYKNDLIEVVVIDNSNGTYRIDDDEETLRDLVFCGIDINSKIVKEYIQDVAADCGIKINRNLCYKQAESENVLVQRIVEFVNGITQISGIYYFRDLLSEVEE